MLFFSSPALIFFVKIIPSSPQQNHPFQCPNIHLIRLRSGDRGAGYILSVLLKANIPLEGWLTFAFLMKIWLGSLNRSLVQCLGFLLLFFLTQFPVRHANTILAVESYSTTPVNLSYARDNSN